MPNRKDRLLFIPAITTQSTPYITCSAQMWSQTSQLQPAFWHLHPFMTHNKVSGTWSWLQWCECFSTMIGGWGLYDPCIMHIFCGRAFSFEMCKDSCLFMTAYFDQEKKDHLISNSQSLTQTIFFSCVVTVILQWSTCLVGARSWVQVPSLPKEEWNSESVEIAHDCKSWECCLEAWKQGHFILSGWIRSQEVESHEHRY